MLMLLVTALVVVALLRAAVSLWRVVAAVPRSNADFGCF